MAFHLCDRVELVATDDPATQLRTGDRGTVTGVREVPEPTIDVQWDDGSTLSVLPEVGDTPVPTAARHDPPTPRQPGNPAALTGQPAAHQAAPPPRQPPVPPP